MPVQKTRRSALVGASVKLRLKRDIEVRCVKRYAKPNYSLTLLRLYTYISIMNVRFRSDPFCWSAFLYCLPITDVVLAVVVNSNIYKWMYRGPQALQASGDPTYLKKHDRQMEHGSGRKRAVTAARPTHSCTAGRKIQLVIDTLPHNNTRILRKTSSQNPNPSCPRGVARLVVISLFPE